MIALPAIKGRNPLRPGVVLFAVLIVVAILMLVGYQFLNLMQVELAAAISANKVAQARRLADSGLHYAAYMLANPANVGLNADGSLLVNPAFAYDNPDLFHLRPITTAQGEILGYFSLVSPRDATDEMLGMGFRFGLEDEGGKLNLNAALKIDRSGSRVREVIGQLPNLTPEVASSLLNWMRSPNAQDSSGDSMYYAAMGYGQKHGPYESFEELLLVRDITPRILLGNDRNRNGILEFDEDDSGGVLDTGLASFLTIYSREMNLNAYGQPRVWINNSDLNTLYSELTAVVGPDLASFIIVARQNGLSTSGSSRSGAGGRNQGQSEVVEGGPEKLNFDAVASDQLRNINSVWDLIDASVQVTEAAEGGGQSRRITYLSPLKKDDMSTLALFLPILLDNLTTTNALELPARVNVMTASPQLLATLPNMTQADLENILQGRAAAMANATEPGVANTLAWLVTSANFDPTTMQQLDPYITSRSQVFRVQAVGYYEVGGPAVRLEAVIDANAGRPRFLYWRELTDLGRGFNFSPGGPGAATSMPIP